MGIAAPAVSISKGANHPIAMLPCIVSYGFGLPLSIGVFLAVGALRPRLPIIFWEKNMKNAVIRVLLILTILGFGTAVMAADADASRVVNLWQCKFKEGKTIADVHAANSKWVKYVNTQVEGGDIHSYVLETIVGATGSFLYADSFPSLAAWEAASNIESAEMKEIDKGLGEAADCASNTLHKSKES